MKIEKKVVLTLLAIILSSLQVYCSKNKSETEHYVTPLIKSAKSFLAFANVAYCNKEVIRSLTCPLCSDILNSSFKAEKVITTHFEKRLFRTVILKSDKAQEVVVAFSGPQLSKDPEFYSAIYSIGQQKFRAGRVEPLFANVYNSLKKKLIDNLKCLLHYSEHTKKFKVVFVGHGIGGSIATLGAFDLIQEGIINSNDNHPLVYAYGSLKIGDDAFINAVNSKVKVVRIIKNSDMVPFLNNCRWVNYRWTCDDQKVAASPFPSSEPVKKSPADEDRRYYPSSFAMAYASHPMRSSFLETGEKKNLKNNKQVGYYYGGVNHEAYYRHSEDNKLFWNPIGSEIIFSKSFKKYQICSFTQSGNGKCEQTFHRFLDVDENSYYFRKHIDSC